MKTSTPILRFGIATTLTQSREGATTRRDRKDASLRPHGSLVLLAIGCAVVLFLIIGPASQAFALQRSPSQGILVRGVVTDQKGAPIAGAQVTVRAEGATATRTTDDRGEFRFEGIRATALKIVVRADGFETEEQSWSEPRSATPLDTVSLTFNLKPQPLAEQITVTASRTETRISDTAASLLVLYEHDLATTAALALDDALRQVPGFSLFRRSGSRTANPTSQGVSLRGVGASGASRAAALEDGIPINDPFGGWVYWGRVPRASVSRIEVVRGGESNLYGTDALGGAVNFITRGSEENVFSLETSYGNERTPQVSVVAGGRARGWGATLSAEAFRTDGYIIVDENQRGAVDTPAASNHAVVDLTLERLLLEDGRVFARGSVFRETRENGTPLQLNRTHIRHLALGADLKSRIAGEFVLRGWGGAQVFDQDFSAVSADRSTEALTRSQRVPAQQIGATVQWSRAAGSRQTLVAGLDAREVRGASDELGFVGGRLTSAVGSGGRERVLGVFGQDLIRVTPTLLLTVGMRADRWRNYASLSTTRPLTSPAPPTVTVFDDRTETAFSPRLSLLYKVTDSVSLTASGYRAFRAPTLNELYRSFRVGNVVTLANDELRAERLTGGEAGASVAAFKRKLNLRSAFFWSEITRPIANVTLRFTPELITRQRQNLGRTRSRGIEIEADARVTGTISVSGGYQFVDATVLRFPANVALEGLLIPQTPRHQLTFQASYSNPSRLTVSLQGRAVGEQFDDDQNRFSLGRYFTLDAFASRRLTRGVEVFAAFENLLDERYDIGRTPVRTIGPPLLARVGLRLQFGSK
ncbi:MAG TPA: TonB-dependent receptor [Blastocatellia bacterium]|nr:TonB-dependent receptor [Blastocatellia bacterium]